MPAGVVVVPDAVVVVRDVVVVAGRVVVVAGHVVVVRDAVVVVPGAACAGEREERGEGQCEELGQDAVGLLHRGLQGSMGT